MVQKLHNVAFSKHAQGSRVGWRLLKVSPRILIEDTNKVAGKTSFIYKKKGVKFSASGILLLYL